MQHMVTANEASDTDRRERIRVVVADDSYLIRESLALMLASEPKVELVSVCGDGNELEATIAAQHPDVVITDIRMPPRGRDEGIRIAARLRECEFGGKE